MRIIKAIFKHLTSNCHKKSLRQQITINLIIIIIAISSTLVADKLDLTFAEEIKDKAFDRVMYFFDESDVEIAGESVQRMALIEIDEATYRQWGSPAQVPHSQIQALLTKVVASRPTVIAIDIDLSRTADGCIHGTTEQPACPATDRQAEESLGRYLKTLNESTDQDTPLIILMGTYRQPLKGDKIDEKSLLFREPSFLDQYLQEEKKVFWSSTLFQVESDLVRRRMRLANLVCENERLTIVPSMQLLVALAHSSIEANNTHLVAEKIRYFKTHLNQWAGQFSCHEVDHNQTIMELCKKKVCTDLSVDLPKKSRVTAKHHTVNLTTGLVEGRIMYRIVPRKESQSDKSWNPIDTRSVQKVISENIDFNQQIVLIGSTHRDSEDYHLTPISEKPIAGIYLVANAIDTLLRFGQLQPEPLTTKLIIVGVLALIATVIFSCCPVLTAFWLSSGMMLIILYWISLQALNDGRVIDIGLPIFVLQMILIFWHLFENFKEGE